MTLSSAYRAPRWLPGGHAQTIYAALFAPRPRVAVVMSFNQPATPRADEAARDMTQRLIQAVIYLGGSYYLPYRLHATPEQFRQAYPKAEAFAAGANA